MPMTIEKTFTFDAGHRALGFADKKEESLHGHTWRLRVVIETGRTLGPHKTIFDTNQLARIVKPMIARFDHALIVWSEDPLLGRLVEMCQFGGIDDKLIRVDFNPTLEGLAEYFYHALAEPIRAEDAALKRVDLDATATLRASYWE